MVFHAKANRLFSVFVWIVILILGAGTILPAFLLKGTDSVVPPLLTLTFLIITGILLWIVYSVIYIFCEDYLLIKSGPLRSRIPYKDITKVSPTKNVFKENRMLSSKYSLELFNKKGAFDSVRISPINKKEFIFELENRIPNILIED